jgi:hypothetical protein
VPGKKGSDKRVGVSTASKKSAKKAGKGRRLIDQRTDKRYVRRDEKGQFKQSDDVGRSLSQDVKKSAKTKVKSGQGVRGDQKLGRWDVPSKPRSTGRDLTGSRHLSEDQVERLLAAEGTIRLPSVPRSTAPRPAPIDVPGKPLSETIVEERR